jgi:general nucleoside transport system ATP-binding protein
MRPITDHSLEAAADRVILRGITKAFGSNVVNDNINITLLRGEVHALLGENGAGKTTLTNILSGFYLPDAGDIILWGESVSFRSPKDALSLGVGMVHQEFQLIDAFTVTDNVLLAQREAGLRLHRAATARALRDLGRENGLAIDPDRHVWQLSVGERQRVEILKLLYRGAELLILDEPTAVLTPQEADALYQALRRLANAGKTIVFITHKLKEVMSAADRITILRQGKVVATVPRSETTIEQLAALMMGKDRPSRSISTQSQHAPGPPVLRLDGVSAVNPNGHVGIRNVNLTVRGGEILGIAGVAGNGQSLLAELIAGLVKPTSGRIEIGEHDANAFNALRMMHAGVRYVPEDRKRVGLVPELGLAHNLILRDYRRPPYGNGIWIDWQEARRRLSLLVAQLDIKTPALDANAGKLSGGNQQKLLLGRELLADPRLLLVAQPTRGLDLDACATIRRWLIDLRNSGVGVLLISEDLDEIFEISDIIAVMYHGELTTPQPTRTADWASIGLLMGGDQSQRQHA